jgi:5-(carboxyamino)imidazole ribonucleotide mutase
LWVFFETHALKVRKYIAYGELSRAYHPAMDASSDSHPRSEPVGDVPSPPGAAVVGVIMGSQSDWETMQHAARMLAQLGIPHECRVVSAHRTPDLLFEYAAAADGRGLRAIIAGAGGAAHLPGMCASKTSVPVLGVPVQSKALNGLDSLLSIAQMPAGIPVATFAIGQAGATNAALFAGAMLAASDAGVRARLEAFRANQTAKVLAGPDPRIGLTPGAHG